MKKLIYLIAFLITHSSVLSQNTKVTWYSVDMGFGEPKSGNTIIKSVVGQNFVGTTYRANTQIISGFLADTLFRSTTVDVKNQEQLPTSYSLWQNYPNPFNPSTSIKFDIPQASYVTLKVYNLLGQEVATLVNEKKEAGRYNIEFRASSASGGFGLSSGVYFYRLVAGDPSDRSTKGQAGQVFVAVKKISFIK